ncbi:MAG: S8 family serine peptidase [bacterium]
MDDYDGWNAYVHSGYIPANAHGVHVAGIAGARGNNGKGISGVNWNVKILPIAGESTNEATVVEALSYIYVVRERYDETNGEEGAFVVADNCSFGKDKGDPAEYPIWEAMYDSLGKLGILSVTATANADWDIDSVGDVPTAFETDYMISVTNTTNKDLKYSSAAYGDTTIDLGAPGTIIQSLLPLDKYGTKTGTSMATPHVAGAIALMFSMADSAFMTQYKSKPGQYVLQFKEHLLNGVDTLEDLIGKTVTGGRLNLYKAIQSFLDQPFMAFTPDSLYAGLLADDIAFDTLFITNTGGDTLIYGLWVPESIAWLSASQYNGSLSSGQTDTIVLQFNSAGLDTGTYQTDIYIEQEGHEPTEIHVLMEVFDDVGIPFSASEETVIQVFPNPYEGQVNFRISGHAYETLVVEIYGNAGNKVFERSMFLKGSAAEITWDGNQLPAGMYYYRIREGQMILGLGKLVKM